MAPRQRNKRAFRYIVLAWVVTGGGTLWGRTASGHPRGGRPTQGDSPRFIKATRIERAPKLDGTLDDPLWKVAEPVRDFYQREPLEGQAPTEKTEIRILYDQREVYFGVFCRDSDPDKIVATELRRDLPQNLDDYFEISIDPTYQRRNAYVFQINPLGTQADGTVTEEQLRRSRL
jgi:hypothetical protein